MACISHPQIPGSFLGFGLVQLGLAQLGLAQFGANQGGAINHGLQLGL